ncbi:hypothetical protein AVEN_83570-1 [Araneus ventricosus]|uniref:Uncharacterized protein n=1 Tax=Araneus ventricosus TaxID=182803 RepID=A0A4Y2SV48_ARAVE|nr:hypothetical protein AVEN_83570-1 [Araneus ventricosus]
MIKKFQIHKKSIKPSILNNFYPRVWFWKRKWLVPKSLDAADQEFFPSGALYLSWLSGMLNQDDFNSSAGESKVTFCRCGLPMHDILQMKQYRENVAYFQKEQS